MPTYVVSRVPEHAVLIVYVYAQVLGSILHREAVAGFGSGQRAPIFVADVPLQHICVGVVLAIFENTASSLLHVALVQIPIGKGVIFLHRCFGKSHRVFAVLGDITRLSSGIQIKNRSVYRRGVARV